jgi:hypothetical protein
LRRTGLSDLVIPFAIIAMTAYVLLRLSYGSIPPLQGIIALPLAALAVLEYGTARRVRAAVRHHPHARPMTAIAIARCVALGKASSLVGAGVAGAAVALIVRVLPDARMVKAAGNDLRVGVLLLVAALMLVGAGLVLERAGIDPNNRKDEPDRPSRAGD